MIANTFHQHLLQADAPPRDVALELETYFSIAETEWKKEYPAICTRIETEFASWLGEMMLDRLVAYKSCSLTTDAYKAQIKDITETMLLLAEASMLRKDLLHDRKC